MTETLKFHPLADMFPLIDGAELDELAASIKSGGLIEPIVLLGEDILDGRNRYRACLQAGVEPRFETFTGDDPFHFVIDKNLHRRHLTTGQRAMIAARLSKRKCGNQSKVGKPTLPPVEQIAAKLDVARDTIFEAKHVLKNGTAEEIKSVEEGKAKVTAVARAIRERAPRNMTDKEVAKVQTQQANAKIWGELRDGLTALTSLPRASDVARIAGYTDKGHFVDSRLARARAFLDEFAAAWTAQEDRQ